MADRSTEIEDAVPTRRGPPPAVILAAGVLATIVLAAVFSRWLAPFPADQMHIRERLTGPSLTYWAGTDEYGRDVFSRALVGAQREALAGRMLEVFAEQRVERGVDVIRARLRHRGLHRPAAA